MRRIDKYQIFLKEELLDDLRNRKLGLDYQINYNLKSGITYISCLYYDKIKGYCVIDWNR